MSDDKRTSDFAVKFNQLTERNQKYVIAIQQALMFAQMANVKDENGLNSDKAVSIEHVS